MEHLWPECVLSTLLLSPGVHGLKFPCCLLIGASDAGSWHEAVLHCAPFQLPASETSINKQEGNCLVNGVSGVFGISAGIVKKRNMQEIDAWEHDDWLQTPASEMVIGPLGLPIRYIQHQRLSDLYWQFLAEWEVHVERNPSEGACPCFNTFSKRYLSHWKHVLVMRKVSQHGQCKLCLDLHQILQNTRVDWATKVTWSFISQQTAFGKQVFQCTVSCSQLRNQQRSP